MGRKINPVVQLIIAKASLEIAKKGETFSGVCSIIAETGGEVFRSELKKAKDWAQESISLIRDAKEPNPWRDASDEDIALAILKERDRREQQREVK